MSIEDMKIGDFLKLQELFSGNKKTNGIDCFIGKKVLVRSYISGVHFGELAEKNGREVILKNSRRLWRWVTANRGISLSEVANHGLTNESKITEIVEMIWLEADEIIPCSEKSVNSIESKDAYKA